MKRIPDIHWTDAYKKLAEAAFEILDRVLDPNVAYLDGDSIAQEAESAVFNLYAQHRGEPAWDEAYRRWREWDDEAKDPEAYEL